MFGSALQDEKMTVWCGIKRTLILCLYFFLKITDGDLKTCTVTSAHYLDMLTHHAITVLQQQNALSEVV